jgi:hypothetical protein
MASPLAAEVRVSGAHLEPHEVAAYVDRVTTEVDRARVESHLAACAECRAELRDAMRIAATLPRSRVTQRNALLSAAGIAAVLLVFLVPRAGREPDDVQHRGPGRGTSQPLLVAPVGIVASADTFIWSSIPRATRYDVRLFDAAGSAVWSTRTTDTVVGRPPEISLSPDASYYWKVDAQTGVSRSESSQLAEFSIRKGDKR